MQDELNELEQISGSVERVTFHNSQNGFTVLELHAAGESVTAVGIMPEVAPGEELTLLGRYDIHASYGPQFKVEHCEHSMPTTAAAVLRYLSSGAVKGIGPATARRIIDRFGAEALEIMEKSPERLREIHGISADKARKIGEEYRKIFGVREVMLFLSQFGVTPEESLRVYKNYGAGSVELIKTNPYLLCGEEIGFSFDRVDAIAASLEIERSASCRIGAGLVYILRHNLSNGHTCLPVDKLLSVAEKLLECDRETASAVCEELAGRGQILAKSMGERQYLFLPQMFRAESYCAERLRAMTRFPPAPGTALESEIDAAEARLGIRYEVLQRKAIREALEKGLLILTGGPGTGKTTTLNAIIHIMQSRDMTIVLAAPTGRAAKRMTELTGHESKTLHRLLEVEWSDGDRPAFGRNEKNPLDCDAVIVDELSMVDITLFESLLRALPLGCRLILVGDSDQLPSVGAGNVLYDLLESGILPAVRLKEVFRQSMQSLIVINAHAIVAGKPPELDVRNGDFFLLEQNNPYAAARTVVDLCVRRLPEAYGYSPLTDIQVLCPSRKLELGTVNLNNLLQSHLNPPAADVAQATFKGFVLRCGDRVMQVRNNYDIPWTKLDGEQGSGVFNGDVGVLEAINVRAGTMCVRFDDRVALYSGEDVGELELAYAVTIHKSQGSEFECVVLPILDAPAQLRYRNLLYTAVTRAKKLLILVGSRRVVLSMVENNRKTLRYTALKSMLEETMLS